MPYDLAIPLLGTAKTWKQPSCPPADEQVEKMRGTYTMEYDAATSKKETLPFVTAWMDLEGITLRGISRTEKGTECVMSLVCGT